MTQLLLMLLSTHIVAFQVYAHPHMFVDVQPYLTSASNDQVTIHAKWYFDEFTSEGFLMDYDQNQNGKLDLAEKNTIKKDFGESLKKYGYFIESKLNGKKIKPKISSFIINTALRDRKEKSIADITGGKKRSNKVNIVYYEFDIEFSSKLTKENQLALSFYDTTIYSVLYPIKEVIPSKGIILKSNKLTKSKCLFEVVF